MTDQFFILFKIINLLNKLNFFFNNIIIPCNFDRWDALGFSYIFKNIFNKFNESIEQN